MRFVNNSFGKYSLLLLLIVMIFLFGYLSRPLLLHARENLPNDNVVELSDEKAVINRLVAVDAQGNGVGANLYTRVRPGNGLVLVNINNVLADLNTQQSARAAVKAAAQLANIDPDTIDVIFTIDANAELVSGRSAGSTMALAVASALLNATIRDDIIMTGDISEDGTIGMVQAIPQKAQAVKQMNASLFLVPSGGSSNVVKFVREKSCGKLDGYDYCSVSYVPEKGQLSDKVGIKVVEVKTLADAASYYFGYGGK